ncbi:MAG: DUF349 domain-containing protein, partial [Bacteroidales bacterium]|nr:DUF349 domain-containing protein [Bacteroidales bacterium]
MLEIQNSGFPEQPDGLGENEKVAASQSEENDSLLSLNVPDISENGEVSASPPDDAEKGEVTGDKVDDLPAVSSETHDLVEDKLTRESIVDKLKQLVEQAGEVAKEEIDAMKRNFYKIHKALVDEQKKRFVEEGGNENDFVQPEDKLELQFKELFNTFREKRALLTESLEKLKQENLQRKEKLIEKVKILLESSDDINKAYNEFKKIQQEWNEITLIPQTKVNEIWRSYQVQVEKFYDLVKINNEFRDYDFKKNCEAKLVLCEAAERLDEESDVVSAFYQLQNLHNQWREIGPVAREQREEIWNRFKAASAIINKKHQRHFEHLRENEATNFTEKKALCELIEKIDYS